MRLRGRYGGRIFTSVVFAGSVIMAALGFKSAPAAAQGYYLPWFDDDRPRAEPSPYLKRRPRSHPRTVLSDYGRVGLKAAGEQSTRETEPAETLNPQRPLFMVASIADQRVSVYNYNGLVARSPISTGMAGHLTPRGIFTIIGRERFHRSNIYSAAPMPFMQRVTWSGIAMHLGVVPGHPASHGCIRLPAGFAVKLWGLTRIGERIVISPQEVTPTEFESPLLPTPKMLVQAEADRAAAALDAPRAPIGAASPPLVNPRQYAEQLKVKAAAEAAAAVKTVKEMLPALAGKRQEAARATAELKRTEADHAFAHAKADAAGKTYESAAAAASAAQQESVLAAVGLKAAESSDFDKAMANHFAKAYEKAAAARDAAETAKNNADAALADAVTKLDTAKAASSAKDAELADATRRLNEANAASNAAANHKKEALRRAMPVSVLVSKKDRRIYVRQGLGRFSMRRSACAILIRHWVRTFISRRRRTTMGPRSNGRSCRCQFRPLKSRASIRKTRAGSGRDRDAPNFAPVDLDPCRSARARRDRPGRPRPHRGALVDRRLADHYRPAAQRRDGQRWHGPHRESPLAGD